MDSKDHLFIEFLTEELPPIKLKENIGEAFFNNLKEELASFISDDSTLTYFVAPRRFGCDFKGITSIEPNRQNKRKGPAIASSLQNGEPTKALLGFMKSVGVASHEELIRGDDGYFYYESTIIGRKIEDVIIDGINASLKKLPIAKNMRWGNNDYYFVRPVHNLALLLNDQVICQDKQVLGLTPNNYTYGHRIMSHGQITINQSSMYQTQILNDGYVVADFDKRQAIIKQQLEELAQSLGLKLNHIDGLLEEVTALVEYPVVLQGEFNSEFLQVPQECLILSMAKNQKYFALLDSNNKLSNKFLFVANIKTANPQVIINGNQKVLSARLEDAKFFYNVDLKAPFKSFVDKLKNVTYHNKLGKQYDRVLRLQQITRLIGDEYYANNLGSNQDTQDATYLLKADLTTEMVGEFPELQGVMGRYYAIANGYSQDVANAIEQHYYPRFSGDELPKGNIATIVALADKLEVLVGIWGIGLIPTGDKDPFALRRNALGICRIFLNEQNTLKSFNIRDILNIVISSFDQVKSSFTKSNNEIVNEVYGFILQRLENYLTKTLNYDIKCVRSILANKPEQFDYLLSLLDNLTTFANNPENKLILAANKRIENILAKASFELINDFNQVKVSTADEAVLVDLYVKNAGILAQFNEEKNWSEYFKVLTQFNQAINQFFDNVMVMDEDLDIRRNRLSLLKHLHGLFNKACNLSEIA